MEDEWLGEGRQASEAAKGWHAKDEKSCGRARGRGAPRARDK